MSRSRKFCDCCQYQKEAIKKFADRLAYARETGDEASDLGDAIVTLWDAGVILYPGDQEVTRVSEDESLLLEMADDIERFLRVHHGDLFNSDRPTQ